MNTTPLAVIILAAGKGTRMQSNLPKVMHKIAGRPMLGHVIAAVEALQPARIVVVVAPGMDEVAAYAAPHETVVQAEALGTGHAVLAAAPLLKDFTGDVLVVYGDGPLLKTATLRRLVEARHAAPDPAVVMMGKRLPDPGKYGRLVVDAGGLKKIVEAADCTPEEKKIDLVWTGELVADGPVLFELLGRIDNHNAKREYYLTAIIEKARAAGHACAAVETTDEWLGIDSRTLQAEAERTMQQRLRAAAMDNGATLIDPATVYFSYDTQLARDVVVEPNVFFGPGVTVGEGAMIHAFSHLQGATVAPGAFVGPFARLRPGADIGEGAHIGNFVEVKNAIVGPGVKAGHLAYIGDADIGERTNFSAGAIIANYDGIGKYRTVVGTDTLIGSNAVLVSPVTIGDGAIVTAGSIITQDVPADAMAIGRARQVNKEGRASAFRALKQAQKAAKGNESQ
jgi:bifunctional UDP-N-acetylglucosamine pyrophosphorylase/glucosamine-1-phosphate N-acetyltransferase